MVKFYLGMNFNGLGGCDFAKELAREIEKLTGDKCISRWHHSEAHESQEFKLTIAITDIIDITQSDYVLLAPLTKTARGTHVEMGLALALDKPVYLYRPKGIDGTGFDSVCKNWKQSWIEALERLLNG